MQLGAVVPYAARSKSTNNVYILNLEILKGKPFRCRRRSCRITHSIVCARRKDAEGSRRPAAAPPSFLCLSARPDAQLRSCSPPCWHPTHLLLPQAPSSSWPCPSQGSGPTVHHHHHHPCVHHNTLPAQEEHPATYYPPQEYY